MKIKKAIIPAAGLGTRFLPQTKAMPKEMLPIIDKPIIQLAVEELVDAGVSEIIIVTGQHKRAIEDHFDRSLELEAELIEKGKTKEAEAIKDIAEKANFVYLRQKGEPKGNARPIMNSVHLLGDEPFFYYFPDDFFATKEKGCAAQMLEAYELYRSPVLSLVDVDKSEVSKYGIVQAKEKLANDIFELGGIIEKPEVGASPSTLASVNGYILTSEVLPYIMQLEPGVNGELSVADAISRFIEDGNVVHGKKVQGKYHDCGNKEGYIGALMDAAKEQGII